MSVYATVYPTPRPWACEGFETEGGHGKYTAYSLVNADGKVICDTMNGGLQTEHVEYDDIGATVWDEQGRVDMEYAAKAVNCHEDLLTALKALLPEGWGADDTMDHMPGVKLARLAIAKAEAP